MKIIYPGTFDPITNGHIDIIKRASKIFNKIILAISCNINKHPIFSLNERIFLAKEVTSNINSVIEVTSFDGLIVDFAKKKKVQIIIRGLRDIFDFNYELKLAYMNKCISPKIESIFFLSSSKNFFISSSLIKDIFKHQGNIKNFIPNIVYKALLKKFQNKK